MTITVWDEDITSSDKVGDCIIKLSALCVNGGIDDWFQCNWKGKSCGAVHLKSQWHPDGVLISAAQPKAQPVAQSQDKYSVQATYNVNPGVQAVPLLQQQQVPQ